jgi:RNAse (barnase) inhibitor barstar
VIDLAKEIPGIRGRSIHVLPSERAVEVVAKLKANHFTLCTIRGDRARDKASFLAECADAFDFDRSFGKNWDALIDSMGDFLDDAHMPVAVVWARADVLVASDLQSFVEAITIFDAAAVDREMSNEGSEEAQVEFFLFTGEAKRPA